MKVLGYWMVSFYYVIWY